MITVVIASLAWLVVIWQLVRRHNIRLSEASQTEDEATARILTSSVDPGTALIVTGLVPFGAFWVLWRMYRVRGLALGVGIWLGIAVGSGLATHAITALIA